MPINTINAMRAGGIDERHEMATGTAYAVVNALAKKPEKDAHDDHRLFQGDEDAADGRRRTSEM